MTWKQGESKQKPRKQPGRRTVIQTAYGKYASKRRLLEKLRAERQKGAA